MHTFTYQKKNYFIHFLLVFEIIESLQCILKIDLNGAKIIAVQCYKYTKNKCKINTN